MWSLLHTWSMLYVPFRFHLCHKNSTFFLYPIFYGWNVHRMWFNVEVHRSEFFHDSVLSSLMSHLHHFWKTFSFWSFFRLYLGHFDFWKFCDMLDAIYIKKLKIHYKNNWNWTSSIKKKHVKMGSVPIWLKSGPRW